MIMDPSAFRFFRFNNVPVIHQTESSECGLTSLLMVLNYYGYQTNIGSIREKFGVSSRGMDLNELNNIAKYFEFETHPVSLDMEEISHLKLPCILHWDMNHFVVLVKISKNRYIVNDPAKGKCLLNYKQVSDHFTGVALQLWPGSRFKPVKLPLKVISVQQLLTGISGLKSVLFKIFCLCLSFEFLTLLIPIGNQFIMDHVIPSSDIGLLNLICISTFLLIMTQTVISVIRSWLSLITGVQIKLQWRSGMFNHLLKLPVNYFSNRKLGDIASRFESLDALQATYTSNIVQLILDIIMVVGSAALMILYSVKLYLIVLAFSIIYIFLRLTTYSYYRRSSEEIIIKSAAQHSHFMETLYCISTIRSLNISQQRHEKWYNLNINELNSSMKLERINILYSTIEAIISAFDNLIILWLGTRCIISGDISLGMLLAFMTYRGQFSTRAGNIINSLLELKMSGLHRERINDVLSGKAEIVNHFSSLNPFNNQGGLDIQCEGLSYRYSKLEGLTLKNVSLYIPAGNSVAITGSSGCGKSTLLKILSGLILTDEGILKVGGINLTEENISFYRKKIACVHQDDRLLSGTIAENISSFSSVIDDEKIFHCARQAAIYDDIVRFPMRFNTLVSELGGSLSGGQKQRIMIARALYKQPEILFMDESTSHLDTENELSINTAIAKMNITRVIVAHRQSTISSADHVINLDEINKKNEK